MEIKDELDLARSKEYALLAALLTRSPDDLLLRRISAIAADQSPLGVAHANLAHAAHRSNEQTAAREFFALFSGLGKEALLPYASHYMSHTLYGRPLVQLRETLLSLNLAMAQDRNEPEDHASLVCEVMAAIASGRVSVDAGAERVFFHEHVSSWMIQFFDDLERTRSADFYAAVGKVGRTFIDIELKAFILAN
ncbi:molecular chaperone TorD family protein [Bradyrhizobium sp. NBAIM03]|uniref:TorD/DmsD family molecular chaperone n=1 Tax=Bradyrhizobium sp. NBAIM03 TaxID=2793816 RepID=UPI001CD59F08|nr:molecular chaperone TorD family protein [Bradyrhizobium sp. NBAIM03]